MAKDDFHFKVKDNWFVEFDKFITLMEKAGVTKTAFPDTIGVSGSDISNLRRNKRHDTKHSTIARNIICGLNTRLNEDSYSNTAVKAWAAQNSLRDWLASDLCSQVEVERRRLLAETTVPLAPPIALQPASRSTSKTGEAVAPTDARTLLHGQHGNSTRLHDSSIRELCFAKAEWRDTNLAPGEGQLLQMELRFGESYTRDRRLDLELPIHLHRVHIDIDLDGGGAKSRTEFVQHDEVGGSAIKIFKTNAWEVNTPAYEIDNPKKTVRLLGNFDWFDLCEAIDTVGSNASLEVSASIGGLKIPLPEAIKANLDPEKTKKYAVPEERLLQAWLRHRIVPKSKLSGAGMWLLARIELAPKHD